MTVYVDALMDHGWVLRGRRTPSCHMFTDQLDIGELHVVARAIGMYSSWFQPAKSAPHYDLNASRRKAAIAKGAIPVDRRTAVGIWRFRRELLAARLATDEEAAANLVRQGREALGEQPRVTCLCGTCAPIRFLFRCLYCGCYFCQACAEIHFGQTRAAYKAVKAHRATLGCVHR